MNYKTRLHVQGLAAQRGMTLIELTVVLLVLVGLAGLMIPYVSSFQDKTHFAAGSANVTDLDNAMLRFQSQTGSFPENFQTLISAYAGSTTDANAGCTAATSGTVYCKLPGQGTTSSYLAAMTLDTNQAKSLTTAGINNVFMVNNAATDATFSAVKAGDAQTPVNTSTILAKICGTSDSAPGATDCTTAEPTTLTTGVDANGKSLPLSTKSTQGHIMSIFGLRANQVDTACHDYVVMGIGEEASLIGKTLKDPPINPIQVGHQNPNVTGISPRDSYARYGAVFRIQKKGITTTTTYNDNSGNTCTSTTADAAKFMGTVMIDSGHLQGTNHIVSHAYENMKTDGNPD